MNELLRLPVVTTATGLKRSTLYARIAAGLFTKPVSLGGRIVAWPASEISALNAARIAGRSNAEICELVKQLMAARQTE